MLISNFKINFEDGNINDFNAFCDCIGYEVCDFYRNKNYKTLTRVIHFFYNRRKLHACMKSQRHVCLTNIYITYSI